MRLLGWLALAAMVGGAVSADARMHAPYRGHRIAPSTAMPLDAFAAPAAAYSLRKLRSAYAGPGIKLRRASDNATQDINFLGFTGFTGAPLDVAAAAGFCAATNCTIDTWYDQSGNARHLAQVTPANQPAYVASCVGGRPCAQVTVGTQDLRYANVTPAAVASVNVVGQHAVRPGGCVYLALTSANFLQQSPTLDLVQLQGTGSIGAAAAAFAWHSHTGVINGAASVVRVDGAETTGTVAVVAGTGLMYFAAAAAGATCQQSEMVWWDGYALTQSERAALSNNQRAFWGF